MAEMIPDQIPSTASEGEKKVFALLEKLPDDVIVYYEPRIRDRHPDFVVIMPSVGLLIIEAKGWYPNQIAAADSSTVTIVNQGTEQTCKHPLRQARDYQFRLMDLAMLHSETAALLHPDGNHQGRFTFPFSHLAVLNNCSRNQLDQRGLTQIFPAGRNIARDELAEIEALDGPALLELFKSRFDPWWRFETLSDRQVSVLRAIIHPEVRITPAKAGNGGEALPLQVLDIRQERNARTIGRGHRIVYGIAGSGKTVILIARARLLSEEPSSRCLILCYNKDLAAYLRRCFEGTSNVTCRHFHAWGSDNGIPYSEDADEYGQRFLTKLANGGGYASKFDAVLVDEAQDFAQSWFACAKLALKAPDTGDLLIVGDGSQKLYRRRKFTWADAGIRAVGRTINTRFDLDKNYRNTREILSLSAAFAQTPEFGGDPENSLQVAVVAEQAAMRAGPMPEIALAGSWAAECERIVGQIEAWSADGVRLSDIALLYRANTGGWVAEFVERLSKQVPVNWVRGGGADYRDPAGVTLTTMHSSKGLQWHGVIIMRADKMPYLVGAVNDSAEREGLERGLLYVAMTRAEERLFVSASNSGGYAGEIAALIARAAE